MRRCGTETRQVSDMHDETSDPGSIDADHEPELTDEDILDAMQHIPGYLDISTEDFRTIYHLAWKHAVARLRARRGGGR
jgi:CBS-domain-containing membrane protein